MSNTVKELFTEKFRPKKLSQLIAPPRIKNELSKGLIQNLLLHSGPGTGKTSTLFVLAKEHPYLYINASQEGGIDTIREKISRFVSSTSLLDGREQLKCVILDELDGASDEFFKALRAVMEKYSNIARFIASANYTQKIPDAIQSRFNMVSYDPINNEEEQLVFAAYIKRIKAILDATKIEYTDAVVEKLVSTDFPDMRRIHNKLQSLYLRGVKKLDENTLSSVFNFSDLFEQCLKPSDKPAENYKLLMGEYANRVDEALISLGKEFPQYIKTNVPDKENKIPSIIISVADYQYQKAFTIDPLLSLIACVYKLQTILNS